MNQENKNMIQEFKREGLIIFKFILFIIIAIGIFNVLDCRCIGDEEGLFVLLAILSAFTLGLFYRK